MEVVWTRQETRYGTRTAGPLKGFRPAANMGASMSAPTADSLDKLFNPGTATSVQWIIEAPNGVTAFTVHYGRWLRTPTDKVGSQDELSAWIEAGTASVTGATDGELFQFVQETYGDFVGVYVDTFTGSASGGDVFRFWVRELG